MGHTHRSIRLPWQRHQRQVVDKLKHLQAQESARSSTATPADRQLGQARIPPPAPPLLLTPALACDPETDPEVLWHIAQHVPELRRWLAANPRATPEMLETISQLGGPGVKRALTVLLESLESAQQ
ncbi:hypothetical protein KIM372_02010 [Bombiscardovia nodaiensis]|uniref:Leucine rich repeat variant domain-containing protein n=1 Tax=Bombiscardovia nodaiensis TaxID=2932181 RepID=A0ABM8B6D9_9BIFI|nr:hypothetical protein KIM372_02010 [Bombiscardovia nodaiensis]